MSTPLESEEEKEGDEEDLEEEYEVEKIVDKGLIDGKVVYLVKWKGWPSETNTWEVLEHLNCQELIDEFENARKFEGKQTKRSDTRPRGFERGLSPERIIGITKDPGEIYFKIKWKGSDESDFVPAKEANLKIPQTVIKFYEGKVSFDGYE